MLGAGRDDAASSGAGAAASQTGAVLSGDTARGAAAGSGTAPAMAMNITVHYALTGHTFNDDLKLTLSSSVEDLIRRLESLTGVARGDQIVLCGPPFATLDARRPLIDASGKEIYLFSRTMLAADGSPPAPVVLEPQELSIPRSPPASTTLSNSVDESSSPLVRAIIDFERQLLFHDQQGSAWASGGAARAASVTQCCAEVRTQRAAMAAAIANLQDHCRGIVRMFGSFQQQFSKQQGSQTKLLESAEANLEKLRTVDLHPVLRVNSRQTLWDCVPVDRLRVWADQCAVSHAALGKRVHQLSGMFDAMARDVGAEVVSATSSSEVDTDMLASADSTGAAVAKESSGAGAADDTSDGKDDKSGGAATDSGEDTAGAKLAVETQLQAATAEAKRLTEEQNARQVTLHNDYETGAERARATAESLPSSTSQSTDALDACRVLEQLHQRHQTEELPAFAAADERLAALQRTVAGLKTASTSELIGRLQRVSALQSRIRNLGNRLAVVREAAQQQHAAVAELRHVQCMPSAYHACIDEVVRRVEYGRRCVAEMERMAERLARLRDEEVAARERFLKRHGKHLPRDLIPGLNERPPHAEIRTRAFDTTLPVITRAQAHNGAAASKSGSSSGGTDHGVVAEDDKEAAGAGAGTVAGSGTLEAAHAGGDGGEAVLAAARAKRRTKERTLSEASNTSASTAGSVATPGAVLLPAEPEEWSADPMDAEARELELQHEASALRAEVTSLKAVNAALVAYRDSDGDGAAAAAAAAAALAAKHVGDSVGVASSTDAASASAGAASASASDGSASRAGTGSAASFGSGSSVIELPTGSRVTVSPALEAADAELLRGALQFIANRVSQANRNDDDGSPDTAAADGGGKRGSGDVGTDGDGDAGRVHAGGASGRGGGGAGKGARVPADVAADQAAQATGAVVPAELYTNLSVRDTLKAVSSLLRTHTLATKQVQELSAELKAAATSRLSYASFREGDRALFLPAGPPLPATSGLPVFLAFNEGCPHRYLAVESALARRGAAGQVPDYVIGTITHVTAAVASDDANPYQLDAGTAYWVLTVGA